MGVTVLEYYRSPCSCLSCMYNYMVVKVVILDGFRSHAITIHSCIILPVIIWVTVCLCFTYRIVMLILHMVVKVATLHGFRSPCY